MKLIEIQPDAVLLGQPLPYTLRTEDGSLLANKGVVIHSRPELDLLHERRALYIEQPAVITRAAAVQLHTLLSEDTTLGKIADSKPTNSRSLRGSSLASDSQIDWQSMQLRTNWVLRDANSPDAMARLHQLHGELSVQVLLHPDASLLALFHLCATDSRFYSATHALLVSAVCMLAARDVLGWSQEHQHILGQAALTMNFAMTEMQDQLAHQSQRPSIAQKEAIDQHPDVSVQLLQQLGVSDSRWLDAVFHHHKVGPGAMKTRELPMQMARLIQRADVFSARLAPRAQRVGMAPQSAMQAAYFDEQRQVDEAGAALIKAVGIYPPGSFVRLVNSEVATVIKRGVNSTMPKVAVLLNKSGLPTGEPIVRYTDLADHRISASLLRGDVKVNFDLNRLLLLI
jgi:HD-GYP domain-containing protein (c-di-GMP phosphodiesterase class II)